MDRYGDKAISALIERIDNLLAPTDDNERLRDFARWGCTNTSGHFSPARKRRKHWRR